MRCATSMRPPFVKYSIPVARKVGQRIFVSIPASAARRRTIYLHLCATSSPLRVSWFYGSRRGTAVPVILPNAGAGDIGIEVGLDFIPFILNSYRIGMTSNSVGFIDGEKIVVPWLKEILRAVTN